MSTFKASDRQNLHAVCVRCATDTAYRSALKKDPVGTLAQSGIVLPTATTVTVLEFDPNTRYVMLPPLLTDGFRLDAGSLRRVPAAPKGGV